MRILIWIGLLIAVVATLSGQSGKGAQAPARSATLPSDIQPDSLNRLPVVKLAQPTGPGAISLYSPGASEPLRRLNNYLRRDGNIVGNAITELAILVAAREGDSQYIWSAHEPAALKAGVAQPVIDAVKYGKDVSAAGEKETVVVRLGRQILREHKLDSATFAKAVDLFGKQGTVELVILMGDYTLNAMLLDALDQHLPADRKPLLPPR